MFFITPHHKNTYFFMKIKFFFFSFLVKMILFVLYG